MKLPKRSSKLNRPKFKKDESAPVVSIKGTDAASYKNLVDALDEMQICDISRYAIVPLSEGDSWLIENLKRAETRKNSDFGQQTN